MCLSNWGTGFEEENCFAEIVEWKLVVLSYEAEALPFHPKTS